MTRRKLGGGWSGWLGQLLLAAWLWPMGHASGEVLLACADGVTGDLLTRGFYVSEYPGVTLDTAQLRLQALVSGTHTITLTARSDAYDGAILGIATNVVTLTNTAPKPVIFSFPSLPMVRRSRVCFSLSVLSGPSSLIYYSVPGLTGGCPEVTETEDTTPPLSTFRRNGVDLVLTGQRFDSGVLLSCPGILGDFYYRGFYVSQYPGLTLDSATLKMSAAVAGTYQLALTAFSNVYAGPILAAATNQVRFSGSTSDAVPVVWTFPFTPVEKYSRVCFRLSLVSGPSASVYYAITLGGGCNDVIETEGTTPPLDTARNNGVDVTIEGQYDPTTDLRLSILHKPAGNFLLWNSFAGHTYTIETNASLEVFGPLQTGIVATPPGNSWGPLPVSPTGGQLYRLAQSPVPAP